MTNTDSCTRFAFENLDEIETPKCEMLMKSALISCAYDYEPGVVERLVDLGSEMFRHNKKLAGGVGLSVAGVVMFVMMVGIPGSGGQVSPARVRANEIIDDMQKKLAVMPLDKQEQLEKLIEENVVTCLQEAVNADDLQVISVDEFERFYESKFESRSKGSSLTISLASANTASSGLVFGESVLVEPYVEFKEVFPLNLTYLYHTDSQGRGVILGVDKQNLPVVRFVHDE